MAELSRQDLLEVLQGASSMNTPPAAAAEAAAVTQTQHQQLEQPESDRDSWKVC
jgi:ribosomal protein L12E/L44/L45/RPP1/RPP2